MLSGDAFFAEHIILIFLIEKIFFASVALDSFTLKPIIRSFGGENVRNSFWFGVGGCNGLYLGQAF